MVCRWAKQADLYSRIPIRTAVHPVRGGTQGLQTPAVAAFKEALGHFPSRLLGWAAIQADMAMACRAEFALFASFFSKLFAGACISRAVPCAPLSAKHGAATSL